VRFHVRFDGGCECYSGHEIRSSVEVCTFHMAFYDMSYELGETTSTRLVRHGTVQGGVLSPIVWNFTMDLFLNEFNSGQVKAIGYADDGALVVVCQKLNTARTLM
jgi:hypothetical protein